MPIILHSNYYDDFSTDMNNQYLSKIYAVNKLQSNSRVFNDNQYIKSLTSNVYNNPIDAKSLQELVSNIKALYKKNIELMIKLKNFFTTNAPAGMPPAPPVGFLPPPPPPPIAAPAPIVPAAAPAAAPAAGPSMMSSLGSLVGLMSGSSKPRTKRGGRVAFIEKYGVGTDILTLIDTISNNNSLIKTDMMKLISYLQFLTPANVYEITELHNQFYNYFNEDIIPYRMRHIYPPISSIIGVPFMDIIDKLNELYVNYSNEFNSFLIPKLNNK